MKSIKTYAAAAAKLSKDFAIVVSEIKHPKRMMNTDITTSLRTKPDTNAKIHRGAMSITKPKSMILRAMKRSMR